MEEINALKRCVTSKFGLEIKTTSNCKSLADSIFRETHQHIGLNTLKRFFGIEKYTGSHRESTSDILALYCGYKDFHHFVSSQNGQKVNYWQEFVGKAHKLSHTNLKQLQNWQDFSLDRTISRDSIHQKLNEFLDSGFTAYALIAPGGYGKSTLIAKYVQFLLDKNNDFVPILIDAQSFIKEKNENYFQSIYEIFKTSSTNVLNGFQLVNQHCRGKVLLFIDGLNEITYVENHIKDFINDFLDILAISKDYSWFKIIISCRPNFWLQLVSTMKFRTNLSSCWFSQVLYGDQFDMINVPLLKKKEINEILSLNHIDKTYSEIYCQNHDLARIIQNPYFLKLYMLSYSRFSAVNEIELLKDFVQSSVFSGRYEKGKYILIDSFIKASLFGKNGFEIEKSCIADEIKKHQLAFNELISLGVFEERIHFSAHLQRNEKIKFSHEILFEFLLANYWLRNNKLNLELIDELLKYYNDDFELMQNVLKWIIKFAFQENHIEVISGIYKIFNRFMLQEKSDLYYTLRIHELVNTVGLELRNHEKIRNIVVPLYAKDSVSQFFYFERFYDVDHLNTYYFDLIDYFLQENKSERAQIWGLFMKNARFFFSYRLEEMAPYVDKMKAVPISEKGNGMNMARYLSIQLVFEHHYLRKVSADLFNQIESTRKEVLKSEGEKDFPYYFYGMCKAFDHCEMYDTIIDYYETADQFYQYPEYMQQSRMYKLFKCHYGKALIKKGFYEKARQIFNSIGNINFPENGRIYWSADYFLAQVEYLLLEKKYLEAQEIMEDLICDCESLQLDFFKNKAESYKKIIDAQLQ